MYSTIWKRAIHDLGSRISTTRPFSTREPLEIPTCTPTATMPSRSSTMGRAASSSASGTSRLSASMLVTNSPCETLMQALSASALPPFSLSIKSSRLSPSGSAPRTS